MTRQDRTDHGPLYRGIGLFLRGTRLSRGLTQQWVARRLGVKAAQISSYENGMTKIPLLVFCEWCQLFDLNPGDTLNRAHGVVSRRAS